MYDSFSLFIGRPLHKKTGQCLLHANKENADQPVYLSSLNYQTICCSHSKIIVLLVSAKFSEFWVVSVAQQVGSRRTWMQATRTGFLLI